MSSESRTFHVALKLETGLLEWESQSVDGGHEEAILIEPPADAVPVAVHGAVDDFAAAVDILGVDSVEGEYCLGVSFWYGMDARDEPMLAQSADIRCG